MASVIDAMTGMSIMFGVASCSLMASRVPGLHMCFGGGIVTVYGMGYWVLIRSVFMIGVVIMPTLIGVGIGGGLLILGCVDIVIGHVLLPSFLRIGVFCLALNTSYLFTIVYN